MRDLRRCKKIRKEKGKDILELNNQVKTLNQHVEAMDKILGRHRQYYRTNGHLIQGEKENKKENTDEVVLEISEKNARVSVNDKDRSYRLGKKPGSKP